MTNSKIIITFMTVPEVGETIVLSESQLSLNLNEVFKENRYGNNQVKIPLALSIGTPEDPEIQYQGFVSANYKSAFNIDFNATGLFTVSSTNGVPGEGLGTVTIIANYPNAFFEEIENTSTAIVVIENEVVNEFYIESVAFSSGANRCLNATAIITTNRIGIGVTNPIVIEKPRGQSFLFEASATDSQSISQTIQMPPLMPSNFPFQVNSSPFGATVIALMEQVNGLTYEYSIGGAWQESNIFSGLGEGEYYITLRDQLGCVRQSDKIVINELGSSLSSYTYLSKANSIRFANRITWGDSENYKTDENTLSCEVDVELAYEEVQLFQSADVITTQFKSNYATRTASVLKQDDTVVNIPIIKKSDNMGIKDKRDARQYSFGNGKSGVYFIAGNTYDYSTNATLSPYALNGSLPEWAQIGNYFEFSGMYYLIEEILFDDSRNADVIVFSSNYDGPEINIIVSSIFDRFNYEVYEFTIDMVNYIDQKLRVQTVESDPNFGTITRLSELIWCKVKYENVLEIKARNTTNTDVFYSTGIEHLIRIPYLVAGGKVDDQSETHKTDTDVILLNADLYEGDEFKFKPVSKEIWRKMMILLSCEKVTINGVGYVKNGSFNTEGPLGNSNQYVLTANMLKTGNVYNSQTTGNLGFDGSEVEIPGLIQTDYGYLRY